MSNRKTIEKAITKEILHKISPLGFKLTDHELNQFETNNGVVNRGFHYYLYNPNNYSLFCKYYLRYMDLTQMFSDLIPVSNTSGQFELEVGIGIEEDELRILMRDEKDIQPLKITSLEEVSHFSLMFLERMHKIEDAFWSIHTDPTNQMESFRKPPGHWINSSFVDNVALWISTGIKKHAVENIKFGLERGYEICSLKNTQFYKYKEWMDIIKEKITLKGYL